MEDRNKIIQEAEEMAKSTAKIGENLTNFVKNMSDTLSKEEQKDLKKLMKKVDISDLSPTIAKMNEELKSFSKKYSR